MSSEANCWLSSEGLASVLNPRSSVPGGLPPKPPDPPDPPVSSLTDFPPLSPPLPPSTIRSAARTTVLTTVKPNFTFGSTASLFNSSPQTTTLTTPVKQDVVMTDSNTTPFGSGTEITEASKEPNFTILPPKYSSPITTNRASSPFPHPALTPPLLPLPTLLPAGPILPPATAPVPNRTLPAATPVSNSTPATTQKSQKPSTSKSQTTQTHTYASKVKLLSDRSLKRLAPTSSSPDGKPRVLVPDAVFERGAALHKEYVVGSFLGKMPDYGPIQSVLNYMWGKGSKLEIHLQPLKHSMLVRVPNDYIRTKILEKRLWYVDTSMFYVSQWGANPTVSYPEITSIPLWAHLRGVPFDLRTKEGLSHAAGLVGEPIKTDDYTKNVSSLNVAHVKVEANLCKPLPTAGELIRENGEIINVDIDYPWTPPLCSHCCRIGHIDKNCIYPAATVSFKDNAALATASVSLQGYSPHAQINKELQSNTSPPAPSQEAFNPPADAAVAEKMQEDVISGNTCAPTPMIESESQLAVDLIADATLLTMEPETICPALTVNTVIPPPSLPLLAPHPSSSFSSPLKTISLPKSSPPLSQILPSFH